MSILDEREKTHGDYKMVAKVSQHLKDALFIGPCEQLPETHRESLEMICVKMARIVCGDHNEIDHWRDIAGYAELIYKKELNASGSSTTEEPPDETRRHCTCDLFRWCVCYN